MADREKFLGFLDMIDGGGAGQRGDEFKGGGIFSMLANLMPINPYGSEDPTRARARDAFYGGLLGDSPDTVSAAEAAATPAITQRQRMSAAMADEARQRGLLQDALDPRGPSQMRPMAPVGSGRGAMGMLVPLQGSGRGTMGMPMQGSGRGDMGMPTAPVADDTEFMNFMQQVRNDPMFSGVINNPQAMRDIFNTYKQQMATR